MNKIFFIFIFIFQFLIVRSQDFVKKDSSEVIPFTARVYYSTDIDRPMEISPKIKTNHLLSPTEKQNELILLGTIGSEQIPLLYSPYFQTNIGLGRSHLNSYFYSEKNIPYYALNKPLSELDFVFFGNGNETFSGLFSQNLSKKLNIGVGIKKQSNKGYFLKQENEHNNFYTTVVYQTNRWRSNFEFLYNDISLKENGGYKKDIYDGTVTPGQWLSVSPRLNSAENKFKNYKLSWRNRILFGSLDSAAFDTILFIPKKNTFYIDNFMQFYSDRWYYKDQLDSISKLEYGVMGTQSTIETKNLIETYSNEFSINFTSKNFYLKGYNITAFNDIYHNKSFQSNFVYDDNIIFGLGGDLRYHLSDKWKLEGSVYKSMVGYTSQDMKISGGISAKLGDWNIDLKSIYQTQKPSYFYTHNLSNSGEFIYDLQTENTIENSITIANSKKSFIAKGQYFQTENFLVFDSLMNPIQLSNNFAQVYLKKEWMHKFIYAPTTVLFQNSIFPKGMIKQTVAYYNKLFSDRNNVLVGADLSLNFEYQSFKYHPYLMQQIYSESRSNLPIYPKLDLFATFKISKVHVSLVFDNFLSTYLQSGVSYWRNYPMTPSAFYFRANWVFLE